MEYTQKLNKSLNELKRITGLSLDIHAETPEEMEWAAEQLRQLCLAYRSKYDREYFLYEMLTGRIPVQKITDMSAEFHIDSTQTRVLFLLKLNTPVDGFTREILRNLFPPGNGVFLISIDLCQIAILHPVKRDAKKTAKQIAYSILDTLNTEAMISVKIAYSRKIDRMESAPSAFQDCCTALKIGTIFNSGQSIFPCSRLGLGQLLYKLPQTVCENFLHEIFGENIPYVLDEDLFLAANAFFRNNLNIAETARQLHMHRNTFIYRLEQIENQTGLDLRIFEDAITFKIASMIIQYLQTVERSN